MTTTEEQFETENSLQTDNSLSQKDVSSVNTTEKVVSQQQKEPESKTNQAVKTFDEIEEVPQKFKNKDGSTNISSLVKSYKEIEPLISEKAKWIKEREKLTARISQYEAQNPNAVSELSKISVDLYEEAIEKATDKEKAKNLIEQFKENPTNETIKELEALFPASSIREIFVQAEQIKNSINNMYINKLNTSRMEEFHCYLKEVVEKNFETLKNPVTAEIFGQALLKFGNGLDSEWFFAKLQQLKESFYADYQKEQTLKTEAKSALSTAEKMNPSSSVASGVPLLERNALDLNPQELNRMLDEYYSK